MTDEEKKLSEDNKTNSNQYSSKQILLVEDDDFLGELLEKKLSNSNLMVSRVKSGGEAFSFLKNNQASLIVLDIVLPQMDGYEILSKLKSDEDIKDIPVIFLSNLGQRYNIEKGESLGAEEFLVKSEVSLDEIVLKIKKVLDKFSL